MTSSATGAISLRSDSIACVEVVLDRRTAPDERAQARPEVVEARTHLRYRVERLRGEGVTLEDDIHRSHGPVGGAIRRRASPTLPVDAGDRVGCRLEVGVGDLAYVVITRIVVGASVPAGNASSISSKPSTDSTDFLKKFVVE